MARNKFYKFTNIYCLAWSMFKVAWSILKYSIPLTIKQQHYEKFT